jgi:hypothetical protein
VIIETTNHIGTVEIEREMDEQKKDKVPIIKI